MKKQYIVLGHNKRGKEQLLGLFDTQLAAFDYIDTARLAGYTRCCYVCIFDTDKKIYHKDMKEGAAYGRMG